MISSIISNVAHIFLMASGVMLLLNCANLTAVYSPLLWGALALLSSAAIATGRYMEGYISHGAAYKLLAHMRTYLFDMLRRLAPACLMDREKAVIKSAKRAHIHDFISSLPDGYNTQIGELGDGLLGGEKQRIGIARAMLTDPDMLVMDEPTSNLDAFNEKGILKTLEDEYADKMLMIVSHRPSTLIGCNRIAHIKHGKISA